jgi:dipeptidyl aminopeptidase/acylaminoacyl peptidase
LVADRLTPEQLIFGITQAADPRLSPDGESVVYIVATTSAETKKQTSSLWISKRDGSERRRLTYNGTWVRSPRWSPDGSKLAFVTDRNGKNAIALLRFDGGEAEVLTTHGGMVAGLAWSPDGSAIAYHAVVDPENPNGDPLKEGEAAPMRHTDRIDYKQDIRGYLADTRAHIFTVSAEGGEPKRWTDDRDDHIAPVWSPDGAKLAVLRPVPNFIPSQLELIDLTTGEKTAVTADMGAVTMWTFTRDGKSLLLNGEEEFSLRHDFWLQNVATGEKQQLTTDFQPQPTGAAGVPNAPLQPVWLSDTVALFIAATKGRTGLYTIDITSGAVTEETIWNARNTGFSTDASGRYVATVGVNIGSIGEVEIYDRQTGEVKQITSHNTELLKSAPPATWERFDIERNGYTIESWLLFPNDFDPAKKYPMVMSIHGGPHSWYGYDFVGLDQALTGAGYIVLYCNPRGSGSYGPDFARQVVTDWAGEDYLDLMAVADEAVKRPYIDAERTGVYGYSYGGFMTSWVVGHTDRFKAAVIGSPVVNLISFFGTADIGHFWAEREFGGTPWEIPDWYLEHSPITHAHNAKTPSLIIHYEGDQRVPIGQGEEMFARLKKIGLDTKFVRLPGGNHLAFRDGEPAYKFAFLEQILDWYNSHIGDGAK